MRDFPGHPALVYLAEFVVATAIAFLLWHFNKLYRRRYLASWSLSAAFFCVNALCMVVLSGDPTTDMLMRLIVSFLSILTNSLHILFIVIGSFEAVSNRTMDRRPLVASLAVVLLVSILVPALCVFDPQMFVIHEGLHLATIESITASSFLVTGVMLGIARQLRGAGAKIVAVSFLLYGCTHLYHTVLVIGTFTGGQSALPPFFGYSEIVLLSLIGLGLVIWLLEDEQGRLQKVNKDLDSFIYSASHDLRAPISSILGITHLGTLELKDERGLELIGMIDQRVRKLDSVIGDILQLSRSTKAQLKFETIDFNKLLSETLLDVKFIKGAMAISLRYKENPLNRFWGDYAHTKMILSNLISNAIKYHQLDRTDPFISISFQKAPKVVCFRVEDNGEGIPSEHHDKVFDMFYRASTSSEGTGLGLYIVKEALVKVKGAITLQSRTGFGSRFSVYLEQPS